MEPTITIIRVLIGAISTLAGVIVWLALYIRKINNDRIKDQKESSEHIIRLSSDSSLVMTKMDATIQANTKAIESSGTLTADAMNRFNMTVVDLHKWIIANMK